MNRPPTIDARLWRAIEDSGRLATPTVGGVRRRAGGSLCTGARASYAVAALHGLDHDGTYALVPRLHSWAVNRGRADIAALVVAEHEAHRRVQAEVARQEAAQQLEGTFVALHRGQDPAHVAARLEALAAQLRAAGTPARPVAEAGVAA